MSGSIWQSRACKSVGITEGLLSKVPFIPLDPCLAFHVYPQAHTFTCPWGEVKPWDAKSSYRRVQRNILHHILGYLWHHFKLWWVYIWDGLFCYCSWGTSCQFMSLLRWFLIGQYLERSNRLLLVLRSSDHNLKGHDKPHHSQSLRWCLDFCKQWFSFQADDYRIFQCISRAGI